MKGSWWPELRSPQTVCAEANKLVKVAGPWGGHWRGFPMNCGGTIMKEVLESCPAPTVRMPGKGDLYELGSGSSPDTDTLILDFQLPEP